MSNLERIKNVGQIIQKLEPDFNALAKVHGAVNFRREASFALQILKDNGYLMSVALENQDSLRMAVVNIAACGLTLNPLRALAYLIPRKKKVCLDVSYRGMIQLAADCGAIKWAKAEIVCENDKFLLRGMQRPPSHSFDPFGHRGKLVGVFCVAKTHGNEYLIDHMPIDEVYKIRNRSESWMAFKRDSSKNTPWNSDESEMVKKTMIRRASKTWPMVDSHGRVEKALELANESEPLKIGPVITADKAERIMALEKVKELLYALDRTEKKFIEHCVRAYRRKITTIDDLTDLELTQAVTMLNDFADKKPKERE